MQLVCESELMKNQTHAELMAPDKGFRVLQTSGGHPLFFSLGTDAILYVTRPRDGSVTGWARVDLTSALASRHQGKTIAAKAFDISQNVQITGEVGSIDLAVAINDGANDHLYVSQSNANSEQTWGQSPAWTHVPYDDADAPRSRLDIANLYLLQTPNGAFSRYFIVDLIGDGNLIERYFVDPDKTYTPNPNDPTKRQAWNRHDLPFDAEAGTITTCLGQWPNDQVAGVYTMGSVGGTRQLQYQRVISSEVGAPARVYEFALPAGASAMTSTIDANGNTHFFVSGEGALYFYPPEQQGVDRQTAVAVVKHPFFSGAAELHAASNGITTMVWAVNGAGQLAHASCAVGSEGDASAWSPPLRVLDRVVRIAPYLNGVLNNTVMFAHRTPGTEPGARANAPEMIRFEQNAATSEWQPRQVPLPTASVKHYVEYQSYTTHIRVTDENGLPPSNPSVPITLTTKAPLTILANGLSHRIEPGAPLQLKTDVTGVLTIVEETATITGTCFDISAQPPDGPAVAASVNPMSRVIAKLGDIKSGDDLAKAQKVVDDKGDRQPLLGKVSPGDRDTVALAVQQFVKTYNKLPADGSRAPSTAFASSVELVERLRADAAAGNHDIWGVVYGPNGSAYYEGEAASQQFGLLIRGDGASGPPALSLDPGNIFSHLWGDIVAGLEWFYDKAVCFFVKVVDGAYHFFVHLGEAIYHFVIDCIYAVGHAIEFVFKKIAVFFDDLVRWLGFIFDWDDILRTHRVIKNIMKLYAQRAPEKLTTVKTDVNTLIDRAQADIATWGQPAPTVGTIGSFGSQTKHHSDRPQANWGIHHLKSNSYAATVSYSGSTGGGTASLSKFQDFMAKHQQRVNSVSQNAHDRVGAHVKGLTVAEAIEQTVAVVLDDILQLLKEAFDAIIDLLAEMTFDVVELLDAPIEIPIISAIYHWLTKDQLSLLDLVALVAAIPATIIYKVVVEATPYLHGPATEAIENATSFEALRQALIGETAMSAEPGAGLSPQGLWTAQVLLDFAAPLGAAMMIWSNFLKMPSPVWSKSEAPFVRALATGGYLINLAPNISGALSEQGAWYNTSNDAISILALLKTAADNYHPDDIDKPWQILSPGLDFFINALWLAPTIGSFVADKSTPSGIAFGANLASCMSGLVSPLATDPKTNIGFGFWVAIQVLDGIYGGLYFVDAIVIGNNGPGNVSI